MPSLVALILYTVAAIWALLLSWIALDRFRHERLASRRAALKQRLHETSPVDEGRMRTIVGSLSVADLDAVLLEGLPPAVEVAVARAMQRRRSDLLRDARGAAHVWERIAAVRILAAARADERYELLDAMLRSGTPVLGAASIRILARIDDRRSAELLMAALREGVYSRSRIAAAIDMMSIARADLLEPLFHAPDPQVRFWAAKLSWRINGRQWTAHVRRLASDVDPLVRRAAVEALGTIGDASDLPRFLEALNDPIPFVRTHAARACARFADAETAEALVTLLSDRHWIVRAAARQALQRMGRPAFPVVVQALWHTDNFAASSAAEILHRTGGAADIARQIVRNPDDASGQGPVLARFFAVGGPPLRSALLDQLSSRERRDLLGHLEPVSGVR